MSRDIITTFLYGCDAPHCKGEAQIVDSKDNPKGWFGLEELLLWKPGVVFAEEHKDKHFCSSNCVLNYLVNEVIYKEKN